MIAEIIEEDKDKDQSKMHLEKKGKKLKSQMPKEDLEIEDNSGLDINETIVKFKTSENIYKY